MARFSDRIVGARRVVYVLVALVTIACAFFAGSLETDMNVTSILPADDPEVAYFRETSDRFGSSFINMVALESDDIFTAESLTTLRAITDALGQVEGVRFAMSVANLLDMQPDGEGSISVRPYLPKGPVPTDPADLTRIRDTVLGNPMIAGNLVSPDAKAALITVKLAPDADRKTIGGRLKTAARAAAPDATLYFGGVEMIVDYLAGLIASPRMIVCMIATFGVFIALLFWVLGSARALASALAVVGLSVVWTLGVLSAMERTLSLFTSMLPLLVIVAATPYPIIYLVTFGRAKGAGADRAADALARCAKPIFVGCASVAAAALASLLTPWAIFRDLGLGVAIGAFASGILALTLLPALAAGAKTAGRSIFDRRGVGGGPARAAKTNPSAAVVAVLVALFALSALASFMPRDVNPMATFPADGEPRVTEDLMQRGFGGSQLFMIDFRSTDVRHPAVLEQLTLATKRLRAIANVNYPQSIADVLRMINTNLNNEPGTPDSMGKINNLWFMLEGQPQVDLLIDPKFTDAIVQARIGDIRSSVVAPAVDAIEGVARNVETRLVSVTIADQPQTQRAAWARVLGERAAVLAALDLRHYLQLEVDEEGLATELAALRAAAPALAAKELADLRDRYRRFLTSAEADVTLPTDFDPASLVEALASLETPTEVSIAATMAKNLPPAVLAADPEGPKYAASTLLGIRELSVKRARHAAAMLAIAGRLERTHQMAILNNTALRADLQSSLWTINSDVANTTPERFEKISGGPTEPGAVTAVEARATGWPFVNTMMNRALPGMFARAGLAALVIALVGAALAAGSWRGALAAAGGIGAACAAMTAFGIALDTITWAALLVAIGVSVPIAAWRQGGTGASAIALPVAAGFAFLLAAPLAMQAYLGVFMAASAIGAAIVSIVLHAGANETSDRV
ncbi:MAG: MMPL family transporter [Deltaproteobacteria bacterium]|nr:MMPL family transporter [Deltaproteobacteria bacterium]